jgi:hypothetical protein
LAVLADGVDGEGVVAAVGDVQRLAVGADEDLGGGDALDVGAGGQASGRLCSCFRPPLRSTEKATTLRPISVFT